MSLGYYLTLNKDINSYLFQNQLRIFEFTALYNFVIVGFLLILK